MKAEELINLSNTSYERLFSVEKDEQNDIYFFNLYNNVLFEENPDPSVYKTISPKNSDSWASLSAEYYKTTELWWFICRFNNIINPLKTPGEYDKLKIPNINFVHSVLNSL